MAGPLKKSLIFPCQSTIDIISSIFEIYKTFNELCGSGRIRILRYKMKGKAEFNQESFWVSQEIIFLKSEPETLANSLRFSYTSEIFSLDF